MNPLFFLNIAEKVIDRVWPDPATKNAAMLEVMKLQQAGEFKQIEAELQANLAQAEINKAEAASGSAFKGGWRPMCGYVCVTGLLYQFLLQPLLSWGSGVIGWMPPPTLELGDLITMLGGMLGLAGMRTKERLEGKA